MRDVVIVPHTHWDREWYQPFQTFRLRLVDLLDDLLPRLEADPSYGHFLLDGQMAVVDDYLAIRPEAEASIRRLCLAGRLSMGPWYILMDEFLVSGETIIRDLQLGLDRAAAFGGAMEVGYLPDMFGHVAQMPQLLGQFGLTHAVVWRGVPAHMDRHAFWWESPDGSEVRAQYLPDGYSNGAYLPDGGEELVAMVRTFEQNFGPLAGGPDDGPLLWMNGTDHQMPRPWLGRVVAEANAVQDDYRLRVGSLSEYLDAAPMEGLSRVVGELRSGARANLLMGVGSNRVDVHQASAVAERALERLAEPMSALWRPAEDWPGALLAEAWRLAIVNSAHDSVCACSVDEVCEAVLHRYGEARQIADGLVARALDSLGRSVAGAGPVAVNPTGRQRSGLVEVIVAGSHDAAGTQLVHEFPGERVVEGIDRAQLVAVFRGALDGLDDIVGALVETGSDGVTVAVIERDPNHPNRRWTGPERDSLAGLAADDPSAPARLVIRRPAGRRVLVRVTDVAGFGWKRLRLPSAPAPTCTPVVTDATATMDNGLVRVGVDRETGTFSIDGFTGLGHLVDDGDAGDTYNYSPPHRDLVVDRPESVAVVVEEVGPLRARIRIGSTYRLPERVLDQERSGERVVGITTTVELHAGEKMVRVTTSLDNTCRDHRLRAWFPLPEPASSSRAECAFAEVTRGLEGEGGPTEEPMATFPSRRFVQAGGLTLVHEGLLEYELVDVTGAGDGARARSIALTLLRCTAMLSQGPMTKRRLPAGPTIAVEGAQMAGPITLRYAVQIGDLDPYAMVDDAFVPLMVAGSPRLDPTDAQGDLADDEGQSLAVTGAEVSAVRRVGSKLEVRLWNPSDAPSTVVVQGRSGWLVDLRGHPVAAFSEAFELGPWRIATAVVDT